MKERPILFSSPMVRAILEGRKTQTRRVIKPQPKTEGLTGVYADRYNRSTQWAFWLPDNRMTEPRLWSCPYGVLGDRLWVREMWHVEGSSRIGDDPNKLVRIAYRPCSQAAISGGWSQDSAEFTRPVDEIVCPHTPTFKADGNIRWFPAIHMPRWASRITLEITEVRVQRLQEISEEDAIAEGVYSWSEMGPLDICARPLFSSLWDSINAKLGFGWPENPWVFALTFKLLGDVRG